jgi:hypothetical protein
MWDPQHRRTPRVFAACYGNSFTPLYVDDVRTSQEVQDSTSCYWDSFAFLCVTSVVDWIDLAEDRYRWRSLVNSVMNIRVP